MECAVKACIERRLLEHYGEAVVCRATCNSISAIHNASRGFDRTKIKDVEIRGLSSSPVSKDRTFCVLRPPIRSQLCPGQHAPWVLFFDDALGQEALITGKKKSRKRFSHLRSEKRNLSVGPASFSKTTNLRACPLMMMAADNPIPIKLKAHQLTGSFTGTKHSYPDLVPC